MDYQQRFSANEQTRPQVPALRIVHLAGGLRAIDLNAEKVWIEVTPDRRFGSFPTPPYDQLFRILSQHSLEPIGADFLTNYAGFEGAPPDWQLFHPSYGYYAMDAERAWGRVRYAASKSGNPDLEVLASKARTYLRLLPLRLRQLSEAYNLTVARAITGRSKVEIGHHFDNEWGSYVDAAIHAFLSDAGAFRDVLSEIVWCQILGKADGLVTSLSGLLKRTKSERHPLVLSIRSEAENGWLFQLSDLRNHIVHVAPVADSQEHHMYELRALKSPTGQDIPTLHVPLLESNGRVRKPSSTFVNYDDETAVKSSLDAYRRYALGSRDALRVCQDFCVMLVELSMKIKDFGSFEEREITITDADIIGPITFY